MEHITIVGGPYIFPELVNDYIEEYLNALLLFLGIGIVQACECFFSYT